MIGDMLKDMQRIAAREVDRYSEADRERRTDETITRLEALGSTPWTEAIDYSLILLAHEWQPLCAELCDVWDTPPEQLALTVKCALCLRAFNEERYQLAWRILYGIIAGSGIYAERVTEALNVQTHKDITGKRLAKQKTASVEPRRDEARDEAERLWEEYPLLTLTACARLVRTYVDKIQPSNGKTPYRPVSLQQFKNYIKDLQPTK